jgi:hypothetical protein
MIEPLLRALAKAPDCGPYIIMGASVAASRSATVRIRSPSTRGRTAPELGGEPRTAPELMS